MADKIVPPWDQATVSALNAYQQAGEFHPYTCPRRGDIPHEWIWGDHGVLIASPEGWVCESCGYRQNWAHPIVDGEIDLGVWTQEEVDSINARAAARMRELAELGVFEDEDHHG